MGEVLPTDANYGSAREGSLDELVLECDPAVHFDALLRLPAIPFGLHFGRPSWNFDAEGAFDTVDEFVER